jgi:hypothetical protein
MCDLTLFLTRNPRSRSLRPFDERELATLASRDIPDDLRAFLSDHGAATFRDDFYWTTLPEEQDTVMEEWGLSAQKCSAFLRTAFGTLFYHEKGMIGRLDPVTGNAYPGRFAFCDFMNVILGTDTIADSTFLDIYETKKPRKQLDEDEMLGFVPAIPLGGSVETSKIEVVKMREQLGLLAQLFGNKARKL